MGVLLELQCINFNDPSMDGCYSHNAHSVYESAEDSQADLIRAYTLVRERALTQGWKKAKLAQGKKGILCPNCVNLYEAQTGHALN